MTFITGFEIEKFRRFCHFDDLLIVSMISEQVHRLQHNVPHAFVTQFLVLSYCFFFLCRVCFRDITNHLIYLSSVMSNFCVFL